MYNYHISIYIVFLIILYIGSIPATVNALVKNLCTSDRIEGIPSNVITVIKTGATIDVKDEPGSKKSVHVSVGDQLINDIVIWAETADGENSGTHIGRWSPFPNHAYVDGCDGPPKATITSNVALNLHDITYEWNAPNAQVPETPETPETPVISCPTNVTISPPTDDDDPEYQEPKHPKPDEKPEQEEPGDLSILALLIKLLSISGAKNKSDLVARQNSDESIIFKVILQIAGQPNNTFSYLESDVTQAPAENSTNSTSDNVNNDGSNGGYGLNGNPLVKVTKIDNNVPSNSYTSAAYSKFIFDLGVLVSASVLAMTITF